MPDNSLRKDDSQGGSDFCDGRVLILAPVGRDAALASAALTHAGLRSLVCPDGESLCREVAAGAGAVLLTTEALTGPVLEALLSVLSEQPPWSDLPLIVLTSGGSLSTAHRRRLDALERLGSAALLERPLRVTTLVQSAQVALQARRRQYDLREHLAERTRLEAALQAAYEKQHRIAETLQRSLLSVPAPDAFPGLELETVYQAAWQEAEIGGDFFDAFALGDSQVALVVGDVSGKGLEAAARMAEVKFALRAFLREDADPASGLERMNSFLLSRQVLDGQPTSAFVCLTLGVLDSRTGEIAVACAGAEPALVLPLDGPLSPVPGHHPPLGVTASPGYAAHRSRLHPGDAMLFITDGITEARRGREFFGYEGLTEAAQRAWERKSLPLVGQSVLEAAAAFSAGPLGDDVCLLLFRFLGPA